MIYPISVYSEEDKLGRRVFHRYSDFDWLRKKMFSFFPALIIPILPPKSFRLSSDRIEVRRQGMSRFLNLLLREPLISESKIVRDFFLHDSSYMKVVKVKYDRIERMVRESSEFYENVTKAYATRFNIQVDQVLQFDAELAAESTRKDLLMKSKKELHIILSEMRKQYAAFSNMWHITSHISVLMDGLRDMEIGHVSTTESHRFETVPLFQKWSQTSVVYNDNFLLEVGDAVTNEISDIEAVLCTLKELHNTLFYAPGRPHVAKLEINEGDQVNIATDDETLYPMDCLVHVYFQKVLPDFMAQRIRNFNDTILDLALKKSMATSMDRTMWQEFCGINTTPTTLTTAAYGRCTEEKEE